MVVDDGSSDATSEVAKMYDEVTLLRQKNMGVSVARNNGAMMASGEYIAFLDSDDTFSEDKLKKQVAFHKNNPNLHVSYTDERWIKAGKEIKLPAKYAKSEADLYNRSLSHCIIAPSSVMIKKSLFDTMGGFDESLEVCEDYELWLRILKEHNFGLIDEKLITKYDGEANQLSHKHWGMDRFRVKALEKLHVNYHYDDAIVSMLIEKYTLLHKGAIKHERYEEAMYYSEKIEEFLCKS